MMELERWQTNNEQFLAAALEWLRLRLRQQIGPLPVPVITKAAAPVETADWWLFWRQPAPPDETERLALPPASAEVNEAQVAQAAAAMTVAAATDPPQAGELDLAAEGPGGRERHRGWRWRRRRRR